METTKLSSKGQVIIPKAFRTTHNWAAGLELMVIDTGDGLLLKPKAPFAPAALADVVGLFKDKVTPKTDAEIADALAADLRSKWHGRD